MSKIYITTTVDKNYYETKHRMWIDSVKLYSDNNCLPLMFAIDFNPVEAIDYINIPKDELQHSSNPFLENRNSYTCLETGEFLKFTDFNDDDVVILTDWDLVQQRKFTGPELDLVFGLGKYEFGMNLDAYTPERNVGKFFDMQTIYPDITSDFKVYNAGVQVAKVSAWKNFYQLYVDQYSSEFYGIESRARMHHASAQYLFNYIIHKENLLKEFPVTFHNAHWFKGTPARVVDNRLYVEEDVVLFNHHKFVYIPNFKD